MKYKPKSVVGKHLMVNTNEKCGFVSTVVSGIQQHVLQAIVLQCAKRSCHCAMHISRFNIYRKALLCARIRKLRSWWMLTVELFEPCGICKQAGWELVVGRNLLSKAAATSSFWKKLKKNKIIFPKKFQTNNYRKCNRNLHFLLLCESKIVT